MAIGIFNNSDLIIFLKKRVFGFGLFAGGLYFVSLRC